MPIEGEKAPQKGMDLGQPIMEPDLSKSEKATEVEMPKGGEI
jgi:hypothetical protein